MASDRAYRKRMETERIMSIIKGAANTQFDPDVVHAFLTLHDIGKIDSAA
jgi:energy-coupling factor transport system substrate-specific component